LTAALKEEERQLDHRNDGRMNSTNPEIGSGDKIKIFHLMMMMENTL
jgi:hypothetical protein